MSKKNNYVGRRFQHLKRLTHYQVIMQVQANLVKKFEDGEAGFLWFWRGEYDQFDDVRKVSPALAGDEWITGRIPLTVQISNPVERYGSVLIYQSLADGKIWARHADEFSSDRFKEIF